MKNKGLNLLAWTSAALLAVISSSFAGVSDGALWGYHGEVGPEHWGSLEAEFHTCDDGTAQSPIDLARNDEEDDSDEDDDSDLSPLEFDYASGTSLSVVNNGHTVQANVPAWEGTLTINGKRYVLLQFHFHAPSEHLLDFHEFPMEMHLVHRAADGSLAVAGIFIELGTTHAELTKVFDQLPAHEGEHNSVTEFDLAALLPKSFGSFRYPGSLTTPPCSEGVEWNVLSSAIELSGSQVQAFLDIFSGSDFPDGNRRPVQALNGRQVRSAEEDDD